MPRHEPVSPEEDLAAFYGGEPPTVAKPPPIPPALAGAPASKSPPPLPPAATSAASTVAPPPVPTDYVAPEFLAESDDPAAPRRLAPVSRPPPNFTPPPALPAAAPPNAWAAALLSLLVPGVGQIYAGQLTKGIVVLLVSLFTCMGGGILNVLAAIDALLIAQRRERGEPVGEWQFF